MHVRADGDINGRRGVDEVKSIRGDLARAGGALAVTLALAAVSVVGSRALHARSDIRDLSPVLSAAALSAPAATPGRALARSGALALIVPDAAPDRLAAPPDFADVALAACRGAAGQVWRDPEGRSLAALSRLSGLRAGYGVVIDAPDGPRARQVQAGSIEGVEPRANGVLISLAEGSSLTLPCARPARAALAIESDLVARAVEAGAAPTLRSGALAASQLSASPRRLASDLAVRPRPRPETRLAASEPPSLFGTVALAADNIAPADWRLDMALGARRFAACLDTECAPGSARWGAWRRELSALEGEARLERVNALVNNALRFSPDLERTALEDAWITPEALFEATEGDCEDFALAKYWLLRAAGTPERDLYIMVVRDLAAGAPHAFLAVRKPDGFRILDSRTSAVLSPEAMADIVPVITVSAARQYLHGFEAAAL